MSQPKPKPSPGDEAALNKATVDFPQQPGEIMPPKDVLPAHTEEDARSATPSDGTGVSGSVEEEE